jgi:glucan phosphoethanolaminetransferase (alkaline phosphatase superfamily)
MLLTIYTIIHTLISLIGIFSGLIMLGGWLGGRRLEGWTKLFLITTTLTSVTGFGFPFHGFTPAIGVGIISLVVLAITLYARYSGQLRGAWRWVFVITAVMALYFNFFVLVVMAFRRVPALHALAPTESEPPFQQTQLVVLVLFILVGTIAVRRFRLNPIAAT